MTSEQTTTHGTDGVIEDGESRAEPPDASVDDRAGAAAGQADQSADSDHAPRLPGGDRTPELSLDDAFDIVKNRRRRRVLEYVLQDGRQTTLSDLAEHIAAIENEKRDALLSSQERKRVYIGLYQCHLPRMDDVEVIEFDRHRGTVEAGPHAQVLAPYVAFEGPADAEDVRMARRYRTLVLVGTALFGLAALAPGLPTWSPQLVVVGLLLAIGTLALAGGPGPGRVGSSGSRFEPDA